MRRLKLPAIVTAAAAVVFGLTYHFLPAGNPPDAEPYLSAVFPGAASYEKVRADGYTYYAAKGQRGPQGILFVTTELAPGVKGYAGPVPVLAGLTPKGELTGIRILENNETPSYLKRVERPGFTGRFKGKSVRDAFVLDADIDGVTRATVTAQAVADGVRLASRRAASDVFGIAVPAGEGSGPSALKDPGLYGLAALFAGAVFLYVRGRRTGGSPRLRWAVLAGALALLGVIKASPLALGNLFNLAALRLPGIGNVFWYVLVLGALALAALWGRLYCGWLCPYGALQEFIQMLPLGKQGVEPDLDRRARSIKYAVLWLVVMAAFVTGMLEIGNFEPYGTLFSGYGGVFAWGLVGATLGSAVAVPRLWCRYLCPVGAVLGLISRVSIFRRERFEGCTGCGSCSDVCSMGNRASGEAGYVAGECIGCNRCIAACPERKKARG